MYSYTLHLYEEIVILYRNVTRGTEAMTWAQFYRADKHTNFLSMKFLPRKKQDYQPNFHLLHIACYWYSAFVCLSWKSNGNLVGKPVFTKEIGLWAVSSLSIMRTLLLKKNLNQPQLTIETSPCFTLVSLVLCSCYFIIIEEAIHINLSINIPINNKPRRQLLCYHYRGGYVL